MSKKKIVFFLFLIIFIAMCVFYALQMRDYKKIEIFDVSGITDGTNQFLYDVDAPLDSDYIVVSGYCYQNFTKYQTILYKILLKREDGTYFSIKTQPIERNDLVEEDEGLSFSKVGFYGRVSKGLDFSNHYYEVCYYIKLNRSEEYIINTNHYMGTREDN